MHTAGRRRAPLLRRLEVTVPQFRPLLRAVDVGTMSGHGFPSEERAGAKQRAAAADHTSMATAGRNRNGRSLTLTWAPIASTKYTTINRAVRRPNAGRSRPTTRPAAEAALIPAAR